MTFVPTPEEINKLLAKKDLENFGRTIRLKMYYANEPTPSFSEEPVFKVPSNWTPYINEVQLKMYLSEHKDKILSIDEKGHNYPKLSKDERKALKDLMKDPSIVIKSADKVSAFVVWDKENHLRECENQLRNTSIYEKIGNNPLPSTKSKIKATLQRMLKRKEIDKKSFDYRYIKRPEFGRFCPLPKIHERLVNVPGSL